MEFELRDATPTDLPGILAIVNYNILNSTAVYDYDPKTLADLQGWFDERHHAGLPILVAGKNDTIVGYGSYGPFRFKQGYRFTVEHSVYTLHGHSGKGIGRQVLLALIAKAKSAGYHTMIGGIDAENKGSIEFHKKLGFIETGTINEAGYKFDRWLDLTFMQLMLS